MSAIEKEWIDLNRRFAEWIDRGQQMIVRQSACRLAMQLKEATKEETSCRKHCVSVRGFT